MKKPHDLAIRVGINALLSLTHNRISRVREFYEEGVRVPLGSTTDLTPPSASWSHTPHVCTRS